MLTDERIILKLFSDLTLVQSIVPYQTDTSMPSDKQLIWEPMPSNLDENLKRT